MLRRRRGHCRMQTSSALPFIAVEQTSPCEAVRAYWRSAPSLCTQRKVFAFRQPGVPWPRCCTLEQHRATADTCTACVEWAQSDCAACCSARHDFFSQNSFYHGVPCDSYQEEYMRQYLVMRALCSPAHGKRAGALQQHYAFVKERCEVCIAVQVGCCCTPYDLLPAGRSVAAT